MIDIISKQYFHLHNEKISYLFYVMKNGQLGHLYYGKDLGDLTEDDLRYIACHNNKASGTVKFAPEFSTFSLADRMQEYPTYGTSDFREGAISLEQGKDILYPDFKYQDYSVSNQRPRNLAKPGAYSEAGESQTLTIRLLDQDHQLELKLFYTIFKHNSAIVRNSQIRNIGNDDIKIQNLQSLTLELPTSDYDFLQLSGAWIKERHIKKRPLIQGITKIESLRGASSHQENPFIALTAKNVSLNHGEIYASNLIYSGNFVSQVEVDEWGTGRLMTGINPATFTWQLKKDEVFASPEAVIFYTNHGYNGLMTQTHQFAKQHIIDRKWQTVKRPIVINSWEACVFDFDEAKLLKLAQEAKNLGMECFVLDDGWFGHRDNDRTSLGDWSVDRKKFPQGLDHFSSALHKMGMQFGLWFEPGMVSPNTALFKRHPDWVVHHPYSRYSIGRGQYVLDFANPEVVDDIYQQMARIISKCHVDYLKWDMNRNITEAYSPYLKKLHLPQGEFFHRYILGVYHLYEKLLTSFPHLLIEGCASGGGRYDLGIMFYSPQIWPSDDSDAAERLDIMSGTMLAYPLSAFSNHVSAVPNGHVRRITSLKFRQDVASFGPLGYELDLNALSFPQKQAIHDQIEWYKQRRDLLVNGSFRQLIPLDDHNKYAWSVSKSKEQIIGFFRKLAKPNDTLDQYLSLSDLNLKAHYTINQQMTVSGKMLASFGLREPYQFNASNANTAQVAGDFQSYLFELKQD
ncbi:alpha-galactosidase [Lactobacillus kefiranofaciens]|uniref:alpha-galactosidase n=1 Tax=Lactobacillus kefiranofaciens TaxID=267818 RepID=UPI0032AE9DA9